MSSTNHQSPRMFSRPTYHEHTMSAYPVPPYYVPREGSIARDNVHISACLSEDYRPRTRKQMTSSLSFIPPTLPRPEPVPDLTAPQSRRQADRGPICISPFRSVQKMKEPFQLRLPGSPSLENITAAARESKAARPMSGNRTLRTWRSDLNLASSLETFGLLPSPPLSDSRDSRPSTSSTYFSPKPDSEMEAGERRMKHCGCIPDFNSCDACDGARGKVTKAEERATQEPTNVHAAYSNLVKRCESDEGRFTPDSTDSERTLSPSQFSDNEPPELGKASSCVATAQRSRTGTVSSVGSSWMPSNISYFERWLQGVPATLDVKDERSKELNRRKCQIVQNSPPHLERRGELEATDEAVILDLTGCSITKPKLVDISRQSSPAMSHTLPNTTQHPVPSTPDMRQHEISAFSPDTPLEMSDSGYVTHNSCYSPDEFQDDKESHYTDSISTHSETASETIVCEKLVLKEGPSFSPPKPKPETRADSPPKNQTSPARSSSMLEKEERRWWDHEWTIEQLEQSVKDFPQNMLKLTSPVIMFLRQNNEKALIRPFRKIFPDVAENLLDCLCAILIARNYVASLASTPRGPSSLSYHSTLSRLGPVQEKPNSTPATQFTPTSPSRIRDRVLGPRSIELRTDLDRVVDNLLFAVSGRSDETLKSAVLVLAQVLECKA
ncbi:hypothetical protein KXX33_002200 [Aspergillus fumigatus]|nr:hypothetical protein KXX33_002200 [Aspergillus fumigatus]KAH1530555.1 hypothetical protein KXX61_004103 [Aspergillus fumigatus]KAH1545203.1 hypothetical protein KXX37_003589 [Aspergillus fumigatus]KAH1686471.1 hypothetical protein KXX12_002731 [Aspergillus fumigatus]KAH1846152.1 hypothetical protein KXX55_001895 [Aspergillus fumigatus]